MVTTHPRVYGPLLRANYTCMSRNIWITAAHIAGVEENWEADRESRLFNDRTEWSLKKSVFSQIANKWGLPEIDLFAARINTQLPRFVSWKPDPESCFVDAFTTDWERLNFYAFPPFCQIQRCLQKIIEDRVLQGVLIVPLWPTQVWWRQLVRMLIAASLVLPKDQDLLTLPHSEKLHPLRRKMTMVACQLSGIPSKIQAFQKNLAKSSCPPGGLEPESSTAPTYNSGLRFVINKKVISFIHLSEKY